MKRITYKVRHLSQTKYNLLLRLIFGNEVTPTRRHHVTVIVVMANAIILFVPGSMITQVVIIRIALFTRKALKERKEKKDNV